MLSTPKHNKVRKLSHSKDYARFSSTEKVQNHWLFCWDFDGTIIQENCDDLFDSQFHLFNPSEEEIKKAIKGVVNLCNLKNPATLIEIFRLTWENGHKIAITTFAEHHQVIPPILAKLGLTQQEIEKIPIIAIPLSKPQKSVDKGKLAHIEKAITHYNLQKGAICLIDDNLGNCNIAKRNGYHAINVVKNNDLYLTEVQELVLGNTLITSDLRTDDYLMELSAKSPIISGKKLFCTSEYHESGLVQPILQQDVSVNLSGEKVGEDNSE